MSKKSTKVFLPLILIPIYFTILNFLKRDSLKIDSLIRICGSFLICSTIMYMIYIGGSELILKLEAHKNLIYLEPKLILNLLFFSLFIMLFFTNFFAALNQLYTAKDLEFIHKSPITTRTFISGNILKTYVMTTWMSFIFILPILAFLAKFHTVSILFFLNSIILCLIFFSLTTTLAYSLASIYPIILPNKLAKIFVKFILIGLVLLLINSLLLIGTEMKGLNSVNTTDLIRITPVLKLISNPFLPSYWISSIIGHSLFPSNKSVILYILELTTFSIFCYSLANTSLKLFYSRSLTKINSSSENTLSSSKKSEAWVRNIIPISNPIIRAMALKDLRVFSRNMGQVGQVLMLLFLTASYLYLVYYQVSFISTLEEKDKLWWINALTISNSSLEAFIALAFGTRIIYPQWSIEGKAIWLMQSAPIDLKEAFRAKLYVWLIPSALFLACLFTLTLVALKASIPMLIIKFFSTIISIYGLVGLGLGLGAYFANTHKESPSEIAASFGSLLFMLIGFVLIFTNLILLSFIYSNSMGTLLGFDSTKELNLNFISLILASILILINLGTAQIALYLGRKKIEKSTL